ncbi:MAG: bifunctional UDP-N-acetylglucosamine diphosphorylase/glucosamine-1-phosphate N-acetyltransferase GlmU, partial [Pseudomonadota bacterium]
MADTNSVNKIDNLEVVVLAAGQGTRMRSAEPKVLHAIGGRPMLSRVLDTAVAVGAESVHVVVGHQAQRVEEVVGADPSFVDLPVRWVLQEEQNGTAHAVEQALPGINAESVVLVNYGDVPLVSAETLKACAAHAASGALALVTAHFEDPAQLGRIIRDESGAVRAIVEYADASPEERDLKEINSGIMAMSAELLKQLLPNIEPANAQDEYYLTDLVALAVARGVPVQGLVTDAPAEVMGINDRVQLAEAERLFQKQAAEKLMREGVTITDPSRIDIRGTVTAAEDCYIDINVVLDGEVRLGRNVRIGPGSVIRNSSLGDGVIVEAHTLVDGAEVGADCSLGPFARIRPGTVLADEVRIGNFVETKKAQLGRGTKASHLTYLGDATLGEDCNVGAGTVTCNYDGVNK